jgi:hypothetical protein
MKCAEKLDYLFYVTWFGEQVWSWSSHDSIPGLYGNLLVVYFRSPGTKGTYLIDIGKK